MSIADEIRRRRGGVTGSITGQRSLGDQIRERFAFPPPPIGSIPQDQVLPEDPSPPPAMQLLNQFDRLARDSKDQINIDVAKAGVRNVAGMVAAPFQALRHPAATLADVPVETVRGTMWLAEKLSPLDDDSIPGHKSLNKASEYLKGRIAEDAPFEEAGQYATAVPDLIGIKLPLAGLTHSKGVVKAGGVLPYLRQQKAAASAAASAAARGRAVIEASVPKRETLSITDIYLREGDDYKKALQFIDTPNSAPTANLKRIATELRAARNADVRDWDKLTRNAQENLADLTDMRNSMYPRFQQLASTLDDTPFHSGAPQAPQLQKLTSATARIGAKKAETSRLIGKHGRGYVPPGGTKSLSRQQVELMAQGLKEQAMDLVRGVWEGGFSRPGVKRILEARTPDPVAKRFLRQGYADQLEQSDAHHKAFSAKLENVNADLVNAIAKEAGGDVLLKEKLAGQAFQFVRRQLAQGRSYIGRLPVSIQAAADNIVTAFDDFVKESASLGVYTPTELKNLRAGQAKILTRMFRAAHDPDYVGFIRNQDAWKKAFNIVKKFNPGASDQEIEGALESLVSMETAQYVEEFGKFPTSILRQPHGSPPNILRNVPKKTLAYHAKGLLGQIRSLPDVAELAGNTLARFRAERLGKADLIESLRQAGLASDVPIGGWVDVKPSLKLKNSIWVHPELADTFPQAPVAAREAIGMVRQIAEAATGALTKAGATFRIGSTVLSPTNLAQGALSNVGGAMMDGTLLHPAFGPAMKHSARQVGSILRRGGHAAGDRGFEEAMTSFGLAQGTAAGEMGEAITALGITPKMRHTTEVAPWMIRLGVSPKNIKARQITNAGRRGFRFARNAFEQSDVAFKRAVSSIHASEMDEMIRNATPGDEQRVFQELWGSTNPGQIAADITSNVMQSYQRVAQWWRDLGRGPLMGLFSSFPYESNRNFSWGLRYLTRELRSAARAESPVVRRIMMKRAMRRLTGMSLNMKVMQEIGQTVEEAVGPDMTDEQKEAFRRVAVPEWDKGPLSVIKKDGNSYTYAPTTNLEYFQNSRRLLEHAGALVGFASRGEWNRVDDAALDLLNRGADDMLQIQQPLRGIGEAFLNRRLAGSPVSEFVKTLRGQRPVPLSKSPDAIEQFKERFAEGIFPGIAPTPVRQVTDIVTGKRGPLEVNPIGRIKTVDTLKQMQIAGGRLADEKQVTFNGRIAEILREPISDEEKGRNLSKVRDEWYSDFGPRMVAEMKDWRALHSRGELLDAMKELGQASAIDASRGRIPDFHRVFQKSIPGRIKRHMRGDR